MQIYKHRQTGNLLIITLGSGAALIAVLLAGAPSGSEKVVAGVALAILLLFMLLLWSLTVEVTSDHLHVRFGVGVIRKTIRIEDILDAQIVRNPWYYGWGIRLTPRGWLYNVSGFDAVELELQNNRRFRIGTDEPQQLLKAVNQARPGS
jgi:hypothetical protein